VRIKMKETRRGTEDGHTVREYTAGQEYDLAETPRGDDLAKVFLREGWAEKVEAKRSPSPSAEQQEEQKAASRKPPTPSKG
jgi:hypothetical protein